MKMVIKSKIFFAKCMPFGDLLNSNMKDTAAEDKEIRC
jgi:hypothetical protein